MRHEPSENLTDSPPKGGSDRLSIAVDGPILLIIRVMPPTVEAAEFLAAI